MNASSLSGECAMHISDVCVVAVCVAIGFRSPADIKRALSGRIAAVRAAFTEPCGSSAVSRGVNSGRLGRRSDATA